MKIDQLKQVLEMLDQSSVNELSLETDTYKLKLKKQGETVTVSHQAPAAPLAAPAPVKQAAAPVEEEATADDTVTINALMVGTFYSRPAPDKEAFVNVGDRVESGQIVCILEAMKLFNDVEAEISGEIVEVLVADGDLVEFGQPLFSVK